MSEDLVEAGVRDVLSQFGRLPVDVAGLGRDDDLYAAGLTSHASVTVMLGCEDTFDLEFPQAMLAKGTFATIASITTALTGLGATGPVA